MMNQFKYSSFLLQFEFNQLLLHTVDSNLVLRCVMSDVNNTDSYVWIIPGFGEQVSCHFGGFVFVQFPL